MHQRSHKGTYIFVILGTFVNVCARNASKAIPWGTKRRKIRSGFCGTGILWNKKWEDITDTKEPIVLGSLLPRVFVTDDIFLQLILKRTAGVCVGPWRRRTFLRAETSHQHPTPMCTTLQRPSRELSHMLNFIGATVLLEGQQYCPHFGGWVSWGSDKV